MVKVESTKEWATSFTGALLCKFKRDPELNWRVAVPCGVVDVHFGKKKQAQSMRTYITEQVNYHPVEELTQFTAIYSPQFTHVGIKPVLVALEEHFSPLIPNPLLNNPHRLEERFPTTTRPAEKLHARSHGRFAATLPNFRPV